jgi:hypothetical protein
MIRCLAKGIKIGRIFRRKVIGVQDQKPGDLASCPNA